MRQRMRTQRRQLPVRASPVVVDKGVINGRVIGGSAAEGNSAVINGDTSLTFTGGMLNGEIFGGGLAAGGGADASVTGTATINITGGTFKPMEKDVQADHGRIYIRGAAVPLMVGRLPCAMS